MQSDPVDGKVKFASIPKALREKRQWVLWKFVDRDGKPSKEPFQTTGDRAKSNDPQTWTSYDEAKEVYTSGGYEGIGFVFSHYDSFCGIDLDGCRNAETGVVEQWARDVIVAINTYAEVSPSGTGVKLFCEAKSPFTTGKKKILEGVTGIGGKAAGVEIYDSLRYFAVTGKKLAGMPSEPTKSQIGVQAFCNEFFAAVRAPQPPRPRAPENVDVVERARRYIAKKPPAISESGGHNAAFAVACTLVLGFGLSPENAYPLFVEYNTRCVPPWSDKDVWHKLNSADKQAGDRNYLRDASPDNWRSTPMPAYAVLPPEIHPVADTIKLTLQDSANAYLDHMMTAGGGLIELGIPDIDYALGGGVELGEVIVVAGRPSHGKSAFALQALDHLSSNGYSCLMVSEEMPVLALGKRAVQLISETPQEYWSVNLEIIKQQIEKHYQNSKPIFVVESSGTVDRVIRRIENAVNDHGVKVVAVDYAQLLENAGKTRYDKVTTTSVAMRQVASRCKIVMLLLCQLNREIESRESYTPRMSDLRESGQLEQDADVIMFTVWPHRLNNSHPPHLYKIFIAKNRNRPINTPLVTCKFIPSRQMLVDIPPEPQTEPQAHDFGEYSQRKDIF